MSGIQSWLDDETSNIALAKWLREQLQTDFDGTEDVVAHADLRNDLYAKMKIVDCYEEQVSRRLSYQSIERANPADLKTFEDMASGLAEALQWLAWRYRGRKGYKRDWL